MEPKEIIDNYFSRNVAIFNGKYDDAASLSASAYMLLLASGITIDRAHIEKHFSRHSLDNDFLAFSKTAFKLGAELETLSIDSLRLLNEYFLPCVIKLGNAYVMAERVTKDSIYLQHPVEGKIVAPLDECNNTFGGDILYLTKKVGKDKSSENRLGLRELYKDVSGLKRTVLITFGLSIFIQIFAFFLPLFAQLTIDNIIPNHDKYLLLIVGLGFAGIVLIDGLVKILAGLVTTNLLIYLNANTLVSVFNHLVHLPSSFFEGRQIGDILSRFKSIEPLNGRVAKNFVDIIIDSLMVLTMAVVMIIYAPAIALVSFGCFLLITAIRMGLNNTLKRLETEAAERYAISSSYFIETFSSMQSIRVMQGESIRRNQWLERHLKAIGYDEQRIKLTLIVDNIAELIGGVEMVAAIGIAALFVINAQMTLGTMFAYLSYRTLFSTHASRLVKNIFDLRLLRVYLNRLDTILNHKRIEYSDNAIAETLSDAVAVQGKPIIQLVNVSYSHPNTAVPIFINISIDIYPAELVCLEGDSGAGKSTLIKIMLGLLAPRSGKVYINGVEQNYITKSRGTISSALLQGDRIFDQTIAENVAGISSKVDHDRVIEMCKLVNMHTEICDMSSGYDTLLNRNENNISGGQEQRLLLARALYQSPKIIYLDEVTSNLDKNNEKVINELIKQLKATRIVIDHRKALSVYADKVIHITKGSVKIEKPVAHKDISNRI